MQKPIVKGCKAITINCRNPKNNFKIVTVGNYIGEINGWHGNDRWEIDCLLKDYYNGKKTKTIREFRLMRIDDPDIQKQIEEEEAFNKILNHAQKLHG